MLHVTRVRDQCTAGSCKPVILILAILSSLCCWTSALSYAGCHFGSLPGAWNRTLSLGLKWRLAQPEGNCSRLEPLLSRMKFYERQRLESMTGTREALRDPRSRLIKQFSKHPPKWQSRPTNIYKRSHPAILFLGDHHDRWLVLDACQSIRSMKSGTMRHCPRYPDLSNDADADERQHRYMYFSVCENGAASFAMRYIPGANPTGPYYKQHLLEGVSSSNASWAVRTEETLSLFSRYFRRDPDMVVVHANYWDLMGFQWTGEQAQWLTSGLPQPLVSQWAAHMTAWIRHLRVNLPYDALIMLRTAPLPKVDASGVPHLRQLGGTRPILQLNEAIRSVANSLNLTLLDSEMHLRNMDPRQVMRDNSNPSNWVNLEWTNIILNVLKQHKPRLFMHVSGRPTTAA